jgi:hypothetical protein
MIEKKAVRFIVFFMLVVMTGLGWAAVETVKKPLALKIKPDIVLKDLVIEHLAGGAAKERIRIRSAAFNPLAGTSTGPFRVRAEFRDSASGPYRDGGVIEVDSLVNTGALVKAPSFPLHFDFLVFSGRTYHFRVTADVTRVVAEANETNNVKEIDYRIPSGITDGGGSETVSRGVDLVVSQVEITRGMFGGREKIQIVPTIRNMWHGSTAERIKILFDGLGRAEWVEGGIGPDETKRAGAVYIECDAALSLPLNFSVEVDSDNAIAETNDLNNRCGPIRFASGDTHIVHDCPISGPHEPLI